MLTLEMELQQARRDGYQEGYQEGIDEVYVALALEMLRSKLDIDMIMKCTHLPLKRISALAKTL